MAAGAYSYTTVSVETDGTAAVSVSLQTDERVSVLCGTGRDRAQISVWHAGAHVTVCPTNASAPTAGDVQVARLLAESFAVYAAEVERLHDLNTAPAGPAPQ